MEKKDKIRLAILVGLILAVGVSIGFYAFKVKDTTEKKQIQALEKDKLVVMNKPIKDNFNVPLRKRVYQNRKRAFYDLHGKFVELKPASSDNPDGGLWWGKLQLWDSRVQLKVLMGIMNTQGAPRIAFARYKNSWWGDSQQVFDELPRVMNNLIKVGDEVVVRVDLRFSDDMGPKEIADNLEAMKELDSLMDNWFQVRKQPKMLKHYFYAERVGIVSM